MGEVATLFEAEPDRLESFNEFWKWYPHHPQRKSKAKARSLFLQIIQPGGVDTRSKNKDSGQFMDLHLEATSEAIVEATKAYRKALIPQRMGEYAPDTTYTPNALVWLNGGDWENYDE